MSYCSNKDCKRCNIDISKITKINYDWSFEKECLRGAIDFIRWDELIALFFTYFFPIGMLGYWGIPISIIFHAGMFTMGGGAVGDWHGEFSREEPNYIGCVKGIKDCKICHNENRIV